MLLLINVLAIYYLEALAKQKDDSLIQLNNPV